MCQLFISVWYSRILVVFFIFLFGSTVCKSHYFWLLKSFYSKWFCISVSDGEAIIPCCKALVMWTSVIIQIFLKWWKMLLSSAPCYYWSGRSYCHIAEQTYRKESGNVLSPGSIKPFTCSIQNFFTPSMQKKLYSFIF